jgi:hypothetical protein
MRGPAVSCRDIIPQLDCCEEKFRRCAPATDASRFGFASLTAGRRDGGKKIAPRGAGREVSDSRCSLVGVVRAELPPALLTALLSALLTALSGLLGLLARLLMLAALLLLAALRAALLLLATLRALLLLGVL